MSRAEYWTAESYTGRGPTGWTPVEVCIVRPCNAHPYRDCARLGAICYPVTDFRLVEQIQKLYVLAELSSGARTTKPETWDKAVEDCAIANAGRTLDSQFWTVVEAP